MTSSHYEEWTEKSGPPKIPQNLPGPPGFDIFQIVVHFLLEAEFTLYILNPVAARHDRTNRQQTSIFRPKRSKPMDSIRDALGKYAKNWDPTIMWGVIALLAIVLIWYIFLRKRAKPEEENPPSPPR
jgi:hypothetical protein